MEKFTDEQLVQEIINRKLVREVAKDLENEDIVEMAKERCLEDKFNTGSDWNEDEERERIEKEVQKDWEQNHFVLHKDFDRFQLRDHLINIAGLFSHASDKKLFDTLADLMEFS